MRVGIVRFLKSVAVQTSVGPLAPVRFRAREFKASTTTRLRASLANRARQCCRAVPSSVASVEWCGVRGVRGRVGMTSVGYADCRVSGSRAGLTLPRVRPRLSGVSLPLPTRRLLPARWDCRCLLGNQVPARSSRFSCQRPSKEPTENRDLIIIALPRRSTKKRRGRNPINRNNLRLRSGLGFGAIRRDRA